MAEHEILDTFYEKLTQKDIDEDFLESLKDLISEDKFSKENFIELIEGVSDGKA